MWELDHKERWALKYWCFRSVLLEKTLESPFDSREVQPVNPKRNQSWIFIGRTEAEALILRPPDSKKWLIGKDPDAGKGKRQEEKGITENEMVGWHHQLDGYEFAQALGIGDGQCCSPWGHTESDTTEWLNWSDKWSACAQLLSCVQLSATSWTAAQQAPLFMGFPRQKSWSGVPFPTPRHLSNLGSYPHPLSLLHWQADSLPLNHLGRPEVK